MCFFNFFKMNRDMGIDLGTANTLIYISEKGVVLNEPSVIAAETYTGKVVATGHEAKDMIGRSPDTIKVVRPLQEGVISDFDMTAEMLKQLIRKAINKHGGNLHLRVVIGVPSGVTEVEKRAVEEVVRQMGAREVYILEEPMAAAIGVGLDVNGNEGCMIADIGGGTTDIAIIALGGIVTSTSIRYAGDKFNEAIIQYMRKNYELHVGERTAEELKVQVGCALVDVDENGREVLKTVEARGRDAVTGLPRMVEITSKDMKLALEDSVDIILDGIRLTLEQCPPELSADIVRNGLVLAGGGGLLHNLDLLIHERTGMKVTVAENAFESVALGAGISLKDIDHLKNYVKNKRKR